MSAEERSYLPVQHPVLTHVDPDIFRFQFAADCMSHACRIEAHAEDADDGACQQNDACCRYGCDVDLFERDRILAKSALIAPLLRPELRDPARWFDESNPEESESPSGFVVRTARQDLTREAGRCVFLGHDQRGCALHRTALAHDFAPESIKPTVCRLYPLSYGEGYLGLADDFEWYSCAHHEGPTLYRLMRDTLRDVYGDDAVRVLDETERKTQRMRLKVTAA
jgi:Fe-S-cluster containining protein